jgi:CIC family chloride channel protein
MHDQFTWQMLGVLAGLKIVSTTLSFVSGTPGGMFAPTLFIGAMLGGAAGGVERLFFPHLTGSVGTYALVGMGVMFAGFLRAPMTSVFMVLEVSGDYSIILPVIVANTIAYLISRSLQPVPIFDMLTRQDGLDLPSMEEQREQTVLRVEDAMRPASVPVLEGDELVLAAYKRIQSLGASALLVRDRPSGWRATTRADLEKLVNEGKGEMTVTSALRGPRVPYLHPDFPLETALHYVYDYPILPVVHRADLQRLLGVVTQADTMAVYRTQNHSANG